MTRLVWLTAALAASPSPQAATVEVSYSDLLNQKQITAPSPSQRVLTRAGHVAVAAPKTYARRARHRGMDGHRD